MLKRFLCILITAALLSSVAAQRQPAVGDIRQQKKEAQQDIRETNKKIKANTSKTAKSLAELNRINSEIDEKHKTINDINLQIADINVRIAAVNSQIEVQQQSLQKMRDNYLKAVRKMRSHRVTSNKMLFILSSNSFHQAYRRMRYLREFSNWRTSQARDIQKVVDELEARKSELASLQQEKNQTYSTLNSTRLALEGKKAEQTRVVAQLKSEKGDLQKILQEQQRKLNDLDRQLNKLIEEQQRAEQEKKRKQQEEKRKAEQEKARKAEEARRAEEERIKKEKAAREAELKKNKEEQQRAEQKKKEELKRKQKEIEKQQEQLKKEEERLQKERKEEKKKEQQRQAQAQTGESDEDIRMNGSFESNKGKLPAPVTGSYRIVKQFGKHKHPVLEYVTTDNPGIEIEATASAQARAVFAGTVSYIYHVDNEYNYVVILKHGSYLTVYAGLQSISVKKGDTVKAGQSLGALFPDVNDPNHALLHFQVRKGSTKLDPQQWIK